MIRDDTLRQIFTNCLPSTLGTQLSHEIIAELMNNAPCLCLILDTTVYFRKNITEPVYNLTLPYTYIVTGGTASYYSSVGSENFDFTHVNSRLDILAMWLRDSTYQVNPYVPYARDDPELRELVLGVINTQAEMIELYPWGNAFFPLKHWDSGINLNESDASKGDIVYPIYEKDEVFEAKYELDSLASFLYLSKYYYEQTGDAAFLYNPHWKSAVEVILQTLKAQQGGSIEVLPFPPFKFSRPTLTQSETTNLYGIGNPAKRCGLIRSFFRPSDDSTIFQYLIPSNAMFVISLEGVSKVLDENFVWPELSTEIKTLASEVREAITKHAIVQHPEFGQVYAFEVDCYGSHVLMDDANFPSLLSLPKFGFVSRYDPIYLNTRRYILSSEWNPWFAEGPYPGVGSPHTGLQRPWHMAQAMQAMTATSESEIVHLLGLLRNSTAGTGFMHESYNVNNPNDFSRAWFAWANTVFGEIGRAHV